MKNALIIVGTVAAAAVLKSMDVEAAIGVLLFTLICIAVIAAAAWAGRHDRGDDR